MAGNRFDTINGEMDRTFAPKYLRGTSARETMRHYGRIAQLLWALRTRRKTGANASDSTVVTHIGGAKRDRWVADLRTNATGRAPHSLANEFGHVFYKGKGPQPGEAFAKGKRPQILRREGGEHLLGGNNRRIAGSIVADMEKKYGLA